MYKKRFDKWNARKYTDKGTKQALQSCVVARRRAGKQTKIMKHDRPWNMAHTLKRGCLKRLTENELCAQALDIVELPAGYTCVTPSPKLTRDTDQTNQDLSYGTISPLYCLHPSLDSPTDAFVDYCYTSCGLRVARKEQDAVYTLWQASQVFKVLVRNLHEELLACINTICISLFMQRRGDDAVVVLGNAKEAAQDSLHASHPIVVSIANMMWEASRTNAHLEVSIDKMREIVMELRSTWGHRHSYTLLAEYKLAWRLAMSETSTDEKVESLRILSRMQTNANLGLGSQDLLPIAIIVTKARVLEVLGNVHRAQTTMARAIKRMEVKLPSLHPYRLEGQSRHADLLRDTGQEHEAEQALLKAALGRAEALGADHPYSKASKHDVLNFLDTGCRDQKLQHFEEQFALAARN